MEVGSAIILLILYIYFIRRGIYHLHHIEQEQLLLCMLVSLKKIDIILYIIWDYMLISVVIIFTLNYDLVFSNI